MDSPCQIYTSWLSLGLCRLTMPWITRAPENLPVRTSWVTGVTRPHHYVPRPSGGCQSLVTFIANANFETRVLKLNPWSTRDLFLARPKGGFGKPPCGVAALGKGSEPVARSATQSTALRGEDGPPRMAGLGVVSGRAHRQDTTNTGSSKRKGRSGPRLARRLPAAADEQLSVGCTTKLSSDTSFIEPTPLAAQAARRVRKTGRARPGSDQVCHSLVPLWKLPFSCSPLASRGPPSAPHRRQRNEAKPRCQAIQRISHPSSFPPARSSQAYLAC